MKNTYLIAIILLLITRFSLAQDKVSTSKGDLSIHPIVHGTVVFDWNGQTIYVDPFGGADAFKGVSKPDIILITDIHFDHLNKETLEGLDTEDAEFVVPQAVADQLPDGMKAKMHVIGNGQSTAVAGISIEALPMYNLPETSDSRHPKGRGNGYVLTMGGKRVYLSGDTEDIPEMRALKNIDIAFVCMNLPYTMDIDQAASAVIEFQPDIVYPYHYRGQEGLADVEGFKKMVNDGNSAVEVRLRQWYPQ